MRRTTWTLVALLCGLGLVIGPLGPGGAMDGGKDPDLDPGLGPAAGHQIGGGWIESDLAPGTTLHPGLHAVLQDADPDALVRVIVQYGARDQIDPEGVLRLGAAVHYEVQAAPMLLVSGTPAEVRAVSDLPGVRSVHHDDAIELDLDSAVHTGRAYHLWGAPVIEVTHPDGSRIDGSGIGVAVVDTGLNGLHADLQLGKTTALNLEAVGIPITAPESDDWGGTVLDWVELEHTDQNGHGSHVGGIVAGSGDHSGGRYMGSAPGASLYGFGSNVLSLWYGLAAWDWVYVHGADQDPPVRVITNSWGYGHGPCVLDHPLTQVQQALVLERDVLMLFSAGNTGREQDGSSNVGRTQYQCPWQGNIGVASMDDRGEKDRDGPPSEFTARGAKDDPLSWPHVSAPGSNITAPRGATAGWAQQCALRPLIGLDTQGCYATFSGTSMSTPYVAGVAALILQARPDLRPADVQFIIQQTAYKFGEGTVYRGEPVVYHEDPNGDYRYHGSHYHRGHGLVDAEAAVASAILYDPAEHPVVYGFDETPAPLWEYERHTSDDEPDPGDAQESPAAPALAALLAGTLLLGLTGRTRRRSDRKG